MAVRGWRTHACALLAYAVVAVVFSWPLSRHLATHLTGPIDGDTGVYVWNQWVFQHELLDERTLPYFTGKIFSLSSRRANLSLHNYTTFANLLALPFVRPVGVVPTFNVVYLLMTVVTAFCTWLLARHLTAGASVESWLAGLVFAWSPVLVTRGGGHFSLVAAAPLPIFALLLLRTWNRQRLRDAAALGATVAWAFTSDVYYAVYCLLLAACFLGAHLLFVTRRTPADRPVTLVWALDVLIVCTVGFVIALLVTRGWRFTFLGRAVSMRGLYTPMLVLTVLCVCRAAVGYRATLARLAVPDLRFAIRFAVCAALAGAILLSPVLVAVGVRIAENNFESPRVFWRSSPSGVDLLAFFAPNPNHPLAPDALRRWLSPRPEAYLENVASLPLVALGIIVIARVRGCRLPRIWLGVAIIFGLLALGPFIHGGGVNTHIPGPWALLRYLPLIGLARTPTRLSVVVALALAVLFACALRWLTSRYPAQRHRLLAVVAILVIAELFPAPRPLYPAAIPAMFTRIANDPRKDARVLHLPFGVRDGASSTGNFTARSQFFQTAHGKPLIGGYLSRVSRRRIAEIRRFAVLNAFITLSEGARLTPGAEARAMRQAPGFIRESRLGYVVIDRAQAPAALVDLAVRAFRLEVLETEGDLTLYRPPAVYTP
jgi:hypothetical protein